MSLQINKMHRPRVFWATPTLNTDPPTSSNGQTLQALRGNLVHGFRKVLWLVGDGIILFLCKKEWFSWRFSLLRGPTALQTEQFITKTDQTSWEPWKRYVQVRAKCTARPSIDHPPAIPEPITFRLHAKPKMLPRGNRLVSESAPSSTEAP